MSKQIVEIPRNKFKLVIARLRILLIIALSLCIGPFLVSLFLPVYIFRLLIFHLTPRLRPDLGKMLSSRSALFASDDIYHRPLCTVVGEFITEGSQPLSDVQNIIFQRWIDSKQSTGEPLYPELAQYVSYYMGFAFWKSDKTFRIENHVKLHPGGSEPVAELDLTRYMNDLSMRPWKRRRSPWEVILVPDLRRDGETGPISAVIYRIHHSVMDGFSAQQLVGLLDPESNAVGRASDGNRGNKSGKNRSLWKTWTENLLIAVRIPYDFVKYTVEVVDPTKSGTWHVPEEELEHCWEFGLAKEDISCQMIKDVKNLYGVTFNAVLMACVTGALRDFMMKNPDRTLPDYIHAGVPFPVRGHPGKLRNFWTVATVKLPVGEKSPRKRLLYIQRKLSQLKRSSAPFTMFLFVPLIGSWSNWMIRPIFKNTNTGLIFSPFPHPATSPVLHLGRTMLACQFFVALGSGNTGIGLGAYSYNGHLRMTLTMDKALSGQGNIQALVDNVAEQLNMLKEADPGLLV